MRWFSLFAIALILLGLGAVTGVFSAGWWIDRSYEVRFDGPPTVSWTLWVPTPVVGMPSALEGVVQVQGRVDSIHGVFLNVTGTGEARIRYAETIFDFGDNPFRIDHGFDLSGLEVNRISSERRFWVWRASSDASANISVNGAAFWCAYRLMESANCGAPRFSGPSIEGWTALPTGLGDCVRLVAVPPPEVLAGSLLLAGTIAAVVSLRRRSRERTA